MTAPSSRRTLNTATCRGQSLSSDYAEIKYLPCCDGNLTFQCLSSALCTVGLQRAHFACTCPGEFGVVGIERRVVVRLQVCSDRPRPVCTYTAIIPPLAYVAISVCKKTMRRPDRHGPAPNGTRAQRRCAGTEDHCRTALGSCPAHAHDPDYDSSNGVCQALVDDCRSIPH